MRRPELGFRKLLRFPSAPPGSTPGTLAADPLAARSYLSVLAYGPQSVDIVVDANATASSMGAVLPRIKATLGTAPVVWINVDGLADLALIEGLGEMLGIDRLGLEDVLNTRHRPKFESHDGYEFAILRTASYEKHRFETHQVSLFFGAGFVLTFHEQGSTYLEPVRDRILKNRGKIRKLAPDYLAYAILDCCVDHYFPPLSQLATRLAEYDDELFTNPCEDFIQRVRETRGDLVTFHGIILPTRDIVNRLITEQRGRITGATRPFLRDCLDHVLQVIDHLDSLRASSSDLMNHHHTQMAQRLNETMKVLTIISTIFIPLTFITSIYGMNFDYMPELRKTWGYPAVLGGMFLAGSFMLGFFVKMGWIRLPGASGRRARLAAARQER